MPYRNALTRQFILDRVRVDEHGCWIWQKSLNRDGYALIGPGAQERRAHRLAYRLFCGNIPDGLTVDHICFVVNCVNPSHLQLLTREENTRRQPPHMVNGVRKAIPTSAKRPTERTHCANGHPWDDVNTRPRGNRRICQTCQREQRRARAGRDATCA